MARLVTLDVTGTCIKIVGSPGFHYAKIAREFDLELDVPQLDIAFTKSFKSHDVSHPCFGSQDGLSSRDWWQMVAKDTFTKVGVKSNDLHSKIGTKLFDDFSGPGNWEVFPEVVLVLEKIKAAGAVLGVISNFDERLGSILSGLGIAEYFDFVLASVCVKHAKPDPRIFQLALEKADVEARDALHVGDNYEFDYLAAKRIGMEALLLVRGHKHTETSSNTIDSLTSISKYL